MPIYRVPDVVEVDLDQLELPTDVPVDPDLHEKPLSACSKEEIDEALKAFTVLLRHTQQEIERILEKHIEIRRRVAHLQAYRENFDEITWAREQKAG